MTSAYPPEIRTSSVLCETMASGLLMNLKIILLSPMVSESLQVVETDNTSFPCSLCSLHSGKLSLGPRKILWFPREKDFSQERKWWLLPPCWASSSGLPLCLSRTLFIRLEMPLGWAHLAYEEIRGRNGSKDCTMLTPPSPLKVSWHHQPWVRSCFFIPFGFDSQPKFCPVSYIL